MWIQKIIQIKSSKRGVSLITNKILFEVPEIKNIKTGMMNIFLKHTSASITINENVSSDVRRDLNKYLDKIAPENFNYEHSFEGNDDMPAHLKSSLIGVSINIPISNGNLELGTWQGIYLCEHRNNPGTRNIIITIHGE